MTGVIIFLLILVLVAVAWRYASTREAATTVTAKPKRLLSFTTAYPPREALDAIVAAAPDSAYTLDSVEAEDLRLILSTPPTATTWGFFYPVYLIEQDDGSTLVEVGIQSKLFQVGPLVRQQHERCLAYVRETLESGEGVGM